MNNKYICFDNICIGYNEEWWNETIPLFIKLYYNRSKDNSIDYCINKIRKILDEDYYCINCCVNIINKIPDIYNIIFTTNKPVKRTNFRKNTSKSNIPDGRTIFRKNTSKKIK